MQNGDGLWGHPSSTQAAIIVPWPERDNIYFIFTSGAAETLGAAGYSYSVVDMNLQNGLGMVTQKNVALYAPSTEKIAVARHAAGLEAHVLELAHEGFDGHAVL